MDRDRYERTRGGRVLTGFGFDSTATPSQISGLSQYFAHPPVTTTVVYSGTVLSDPGYTSSFPLTTQAYDFRGIGKSDVVIYYPGLSTFYIALSDGTGGFTYSNFLTHLPNNDDKFEILRTGDFNGDGKADL